MNICSCIYVRFHTSACFNKPTMTQQNVSKPRYEMQNVIRTKNKQKKKILNSTQTKVCMVCILSCLSFRSMDRKSILPVVSTSCKRLHRPMNVPVRPTPALQQIKNIETKGFFLIHRFPPPFYGQLISIFHVFSRKVLTVTIVLDKEDNTTIVKKVLLLDRHTSVTQLSSVTRHSYK